jgi:alpha-beta hydrolase superfamily lysophospholipase
VNTLGNESLRLPRSLRHAAERLSSAGFPVLRFDFYGTGDSSGEESETNQMDQWLKDVELAIEELKKRSGLNKISLVGVRFGATLAAQVSANLGSIEDVVLWEPCVSGNAYIKETSRQHKILVALSPSGFTFDQKDGAVKGKEFLGFFINDATLSAFEKIDLMSLDRSPAKNVVVMGAESTPGTFQKLFDHFAHVGAKVEYQQAAGYQGIFREALHSEVPVQFLDRLTEWFLQKYNQKYKRTVPAKSISAPETRSKVFHESAHFYGKKEQLFGILTSPNEKSPRPEQTAVIIVNAGVGTRIGPHRLYVQMARALGALGFSVFRTDLSGTGDSLVENPEEESDPYPKLAVSDISDAITFLQDQHSIKRFVVAGICSGADVAFRAAVQDLRITGAVIINPRSFCAYNFPDLELHVRAHHLESTLKKGKNWMKLLQSRSGAYTRIVQVGRSALFRLKQVVLKTIHVPNETGFPVKDIPDGFNKILKRGSNIFLAVSDGDPGTEYVEIHFPQEMRTLEASNKGFHRIRLKGTDHLFTLKYAREAVLKTITEHLTKTQS